MLILLRDTDLDGQPIIGSGLLISGETALEVVHKMQATSPFNVGDLTGYMRHVLDAACDDEALPEDGETAARTFLERLARQGLVEFVKEGLTEAAPPEQLDKALTTVRDSGLTNMLDYPEVARLAREFGFPEAADWIDAYPTSYTRLLLRGGFHPIEDSCVEEGGTPSAAKRV